MLDAASASARSDLGTGSTSKTSLVSTIRLPEASALSLAQNSHFIFAGLPSGAIRVWKATSLRHHCDLDGHSGSVLALLVVTELRKNWLISASADGTIRVWDSRTLKPLWAIFTPTDGFGDALSLAYFDNRVVFGFQSSAIMWVDLPPIPENHACDGIRTPPPAGRYNKFFDSQPALDLSRAQASAHGRLYSSLNELTLVSSRSSSGSLSALDTSHNIVEDSANCMTVDVDDVLLSAHYGYIYALAFAYLDGTAVLISGSGDGTIKLWTSSLSKGLTYLHTLLDEQEEAVLALEVRNDTTLYASFQGGKIRVFDLSTFTLIRTLVATKDEDVISLATAGSAMASTSENGVLKVWNPSFLLETSQQAHEGIALCCTASADGQYIYTGGNDGTIKVWYSSQDAIASSLQSAALQGRLFTLLAEFIKYRSVSSDHGCREECRQTAIWLKDALGTLGADATLLSGAPDRNPLVLAKFVKREPQAPYTSTRKRVLFYGHYDVVSEQGSWTSGDPFTLTGIDGCLYGRGVIDNKGPILAVATAAADLLEVNELDIDLVMLLEGEEETDSAGFQDACKRHAAEIGKIDAVLVSNSYSLSEDLPSIMFGLRGRVNLTVSVTSPNPDLHSGQHGGICPEPLIDLTRTLGSLTEPRTGRVSVPGFYDQIRHLDSSEEEAYDEIVRRCSIEMLADFTRHSRFSDPKQALLNSWREPSLSIHRIEVSGSSISTVIPAKAKATVSVRTVPDMPLKSTSAAVVRHLEDVFESGKVTNGGNVLKITIDSAAPWWIADRTHPFSKAAEKAVFEEWNAQPLWIREGGSLPSLPFLEQQFQACVVHLPMGVQGDHAHLTDERTNVTNLQKGYKVVQNWLKAIPTVSEQSNRPVSVAI